MQTVFRLIKKNCLRRCRELLGQPLLPVGGHTVHEQAIFFGQGKDFRIHPIRLHFLETIVFLVLASHAYPNAGIDDVRTLGCLPGILRMALSPGQTSRLAKFLDFRTEVESQPGQAKWTSIPRGLRPKSMSWPCCKRYPRKKPIFSPAVPRKDRVSPPFFPRSSGSRHRFDR